MTYKLEDSERRIIVLEEKLKHAEEPFRATETDVSTETKFNCKTCGESFEIKKKLRVHMLEKHPPTVKCNDCQEVFHKSCDLEVHIKAYHTSAKKYECEKKFVLKWRLKKHHKFMTFKLQKSVITLTTRKFVHLKILGACLSMCYLECVNMEKCALTNFVNFNMK